MVGKTVKITQNRFRKQIVSFEFVQASTVNELDMITLNKNICSKLWLNNVMTVLTYLRLTVTVKISRR